MKVLVILGHPNKESFNHAIAKKVVETLLNNGHEVFFHDLYDDNFDPTDFPQISDYYSDIFIGKL
jgi:putative NADPH-quinone reductase